jgi:hypothetical protein
LVIDQERGWWRELKVNSGLRRLLYALWRIAWEKLLGQEAIVDCKIGGLSQILEL